MLSFDAFEVVTSLEPVPAQPPAKRARVVFHLETFPDHLEQQIQLSRARLEFEIARLLLHPAPDCPGCLLGDLALSSAPFLVVPAADTVILHAPQPVSHGGVGPDRLHVAGLSCDHVFRTPNSAKVAHGCRRLWAGGWQTAVIARVTPWTGSIFCISSPSHKDSVRSGLFSGLRVA